jgi:hypothetical protein
MLSEFDLLQQALAYLQHMSHRLFLCFFGGDSVACVAYWRYIFRDFQHGVEESRRKEPVSCGNLNKNNLNLIQI